MAPDRTAACQSWICSPCCKSCVYGLCAFAEVFFFPVLTLYSLRSIVWGLFFFSPHFPDVNAVFFLPCLPVLSTPLSYVCCVCMDRLMANFAGTCTSDNKGLLLLLLIPMQHVSILRIFSRFCSRITHANDHVQRLKVPSESARDHCL